MDFEDSLKRFHLQQIVIQLLAEMPEFHPPVVIEHLLRRGDLLLVGGKSKRWKSWARMDLLYCIANGFDWLGFKCHKGLVVHFDLELDPSDVRSRFETIHNAYCQAGFKGNCDNMRFASLRGKPFAIDELETLPELLAEYNPAVFSLDPVYRLLGGRSENDQAAVNELLNKFLALGSVLNCAIALTQHFSKGNQSEKDPEDRFSGSGVWARFPDCLITITDLEEENCFAADFLLRSFPPLDPLALRWEFPRFQIDSALDTDQLKTKAKTGRKDKITPDQLCALLSADDTISFNDFLSRAHKAFGISKATLARKLAVAKANGSIFQNAFGYGLTSKYCSENNGQSHPNPAP